MKNSNLAHNDLVYLPQIPDFVLPDELQPPPTNNKKKTKSRKITRLFHLKVRYFFALLFIFCCCMLFLLSFSYSTLINNNIEKYKKELSDLNDENTALKVQIAEQIDLNYIEAVATAKLGMAKPKPYQERYISIPKSDHTVTFGVDEILNDKKGFSLFSLFDFFKKAG